MDGGINPFEYEVDLEQGHSLHSRRTDNSEVVQKRKTYDRVLAVAKRDFDGMARLTRRTPIQMTRGTKSAPANESGPNISPSKDFARFPTRSNQQAHDIFLNTSKRPNYSKDRPKTSTSPPSKTVQQEVGSENNSIEQLQFHDLQEFSLDGGDSVFSQFSVSSNFSQYSMAESYSTPSLLPIRGTVDSRNRCMLVPRVRGENSSSKDLEKAKMKAARRFVTRFAMKILEQNKFIQSKDLVDKLIQLTDGGVSAQKITREMKREDMEAMMSCPPVWVSRMLSQRNQFICFVIFESWKKSVYLRKLRGEMEVMKAEFEAKFAKMKVEYETRLRQSSRMDVSLLDEEAKEALAKQLLKTVDPQTRAVLIETPAASPEIGKGRKKSIAKEKVGRGAEKKKEELFVPARNPSLDLKKQNSIVKMEGLEVGSQSETPTLIKMKSMSFEELPCENLLTKYLSNRFGGSSGIKNGDTSHIMIAAGKTQNWATVLHKFEVEDPSADDIFARYRGMTTAEVQEIFDNMTFSNDMDQSCDSKDSSPANIRAVSPSDDDAGEDDGLDDLDEATLESIEGASEKKAKKSKKRKKKGPSKKKPERTRDQNYGPNFAVPDYWKPFLKGSTSKAAGKEWNLKQLKCTILQIFDAKAQIDKENLARTTYKPQDTLSQFVTNYFLLTFGTRKLVESRLAAFVLSLLKYRDDWLVSNFSRFCGIYDPQPIDALGFFLSAFSILLLTLMSRDISKSGDKKTINFLNPQMIRLSKCLRSYKAIFKLINMPKDEANGILQMLNDKQIAYAVPLRGASKDDKRTGLIVPALEFEVALSFVPKLWSWTQEKTASVIQSAFEDFDIDKSGVLEFEEFEDMIRSLHKNSAVGTSKNFTDGIEVRRLYLEVLRASSSEEVTLEALLSAAFQVASLRDVVGTVRNAMSTFAKTQALITIQRLLRNFIKVKRREKARKMAAEAIPAV